MRIDSLYRYPVKGLSPERLETITVRVGVGFPLDCKYALLRRDTVLPLETGKTTSKLISKSRFLKTLLNTV